MLSDPFARDVKNGFRSLHAHDDKPSHSTNREWHDREVSVVARVRGERTLDRLGGAGGSYKRRRTIIATLMAHYYSCPYVLETLLALQQHIL